MGDPNPVPTTPTGNNGGNGESTPTPTTNGGNENYKVFKTKEDFDNHSAGILNNAKHKAEKEILELLGLKPEEKEKLSKFKEAYDNTLSDAEKKAEELTNLNNEVGKLKSDLVEKDAIISALSKLTNKSVTDVEKLVKMAKGLVDENTTMDEALSEVFSLTKVEKPTVPQSTPPTTNTTTPQPSNPFKESNLTEQGKLMKKDIVEARRLYYEAFGKNPNW